MGTPATTSRTTPGGVKLGDGFSTKVAFSLDADISLWEVEVTPPGLDGGDRVDNTTMHNTTWMTFAPQTLIDMTPASFTAAYDPDAYDECQAILNSEGSVTVEFPDGSTLDFFGYLSKFEPQGVSRGNMPLATVTIQPTNWDPDNDVEAGPVMTEVAGT